MTKIATLNVKPDRLAANLALLEQASDEAWELVKKYQALGLIEPLIRGLFHDIAFELQMGPAAFIEDGDEPA
ncbi:hypothetical protein D3C78_1496100 [compost metagenome]